MKKTFLFIFMLYTYTMNSQIIVTTGTTANQMAQAVVGVGYSVSNAILTSAPNSTGTFTNGSTTNLGINAGAVLTSGNANNISNPGLSFSSACPGSGTPAPVNPISDINGGQTAYDMCTLEFDIVPYCNTFSMKFVFGSEEYPEYVGYYNDAFGIFISGPNPAGGNFADVNIALIPNTAIPITVPTVNATTNAAYYINNQNGNSIVYDGLTIPIVASIKVLPCSTYHVKIMIADGNDCAYDSGVFLTGEDVTCPPKSLDVSPDANVCPGESAMLTASGADHYMWTPTTGLDTNAGPIVIATPTVTTTYVVFGYLGCDILNGITDSMTVYVLPSPVMSIYATPSSVIVIPEQTTLNATGAASYFWLPSGDTTASITVSPSTTTTYTVMGTDGNSCTAATTITVEVIGPFFIPNAFTPNGDGINDVFMPKTVLVGENIESYEFLIFDRWGNLIFETSDINAGWNGTVKNGEIAQEDAYVWRINCKVKGDYARTYIGHVSVIK